MTGDRVSLLALEAAAERFADADARLTRAIADAVAAGLSLRTIARAVNLSPETVRTRATRAT